MERMSKRTCRVPARKSGKASFPALHMKTTTKLLSATYREYKNFSRHRNVAQYADVGIWKENSVF